MVEAVNQPQMFDLLLLDISSKDLHSKISEKLNIQYLHEFIGNVPSKFSGIVYGPNRRVFFPIVVEVRKQKRMVIFLLDTGSPSTYICQEVWDSFKMDTSRERMTAKLNDRNQIVFLPPLNCHFSDMSILGTDYMDANNCVLRIDFSRSSAELELGIVE